MKALKLVLLFGLLLQGSLFASEATDEAVLLGLFRSLDSKSASEKQRILRQITLFETTPRLRRQVSTPKLATILLDPTESEEVRREAAKAILTLDGEKKLARAFIPLLQKDKVDVKSGLEALWLSGDAIFFPPCIELTTRTDTEATLREQALITSLALWQTDSCSNELQRFVDANLQAPENPALVSLKKSLRKKKGRKKSAAMKHLEKLAYAKTDEESTSTQFKALLILGCLKERRAVTLLIQNFKNESSMRRQILGRFFGYFGEKQAIPALRDCSKNDTSARVRQSCRSSLKFF